MNRLPVKSSQIKSIGYHPGTRIMEVEFHPIQGEKKTSVYQYSGVSPEQFSQQMKAASIGSHFIRNFKQQPDKFPFKKIE